MTANGSGRRRPASEAVAVGAAAVCDAAVARGRAGERGFAADRRAPAFAALLPPGLARLDDDDALALALRDEAAPFAALAGALAREAVAADARLRERAGVSVAAAASGAAGVEAAPLDAGRVRLALRRVGRLRGRLFRTSRSPSFDEPLLGGMARLWPIRSRGAPASPNRKPRTRFHVGRSRLQWRAERRFDRIERQAISSHVNA
jgi:hypothetical protein